MREMAGSGLPAAIRVKTKLHIADTIGIAIAASTTPFGQQFIHSPAMGGARGDCAVVGSELRLPPALAAFAHSGLAHMLDDIHDEARLHPTTVTFPAAVAAAQLSGAEGSSVIEAVALANEILCRLGVICSPNGGGPASGWFLTQLLGYTGACLAAGIALGYSDDELVSAIGLASMQAAGSKQAAFGIGSTARSICPAFAAMGGVHAALLARGSIVGPAFTLMVSQACFHFTWAERSTRKQPPFCSIINMAVTGYRD
jgi:2-methylcitrate dehydratase PrpD